MDINYKIKKEAAYMKHYGPEKLAKKAIGKLMDRYCIVMVVSCLIIS